MECRPVTMRGLQESLFQVGVAVLLANEELQGPQAARQQRQSGAGVEKFPPPADLEPTDHQSS